MSNWISAREALPCKGKIMLVYSAIVERFVIARCEKFSDGEYYWMDYNNARNVYSVRPDDYWMEIPPVAEYVIKKENAE